MQNASSEIINHQCFLMSPNEVLRKKLKLRARHTDIMNSQFIVMCQLTEDTLSDVAPRGEFPKAVGNQKCFFDRPQIRKDVEVHFILLS